MGSDRVMWVKLPNSLIFFENMTILLVTGNLSLLSINNVQNHVLALSVEFYEEPIILPTLPHLVCPGGGNVGKKVLCFNAILLFLNPYDNSN